MVVDAGIAAALGSAATWALASTLMATQTARLDPSSISAIRLGWAAAFFAAVLVAGNQAGELIDVGWSHTAQLILGALLGLGIGDTLYVRALGVVGLARAFTVTMGLYTVFTYAIAAALLGESVGLLVIAGSALVLASVYVVSFLGRSGALSQAGTGAARQPADVVRGLVLVCLASLCWAGATVWTRSIADEHSAVAVGAVRLPAAALLVGSFVAANRASSLRRRQVTRRAIAVLAVAGIAGTGLGSLLFIYALQHAGAGEAAVLSSASPLFALPLGAFVLREPVTRWVVAGAVMAVTGIVLLSL